VKTDNNWKHDLNKLKKATNFEEKEEEKVFFILY